MLGSMPRWRQPTGCRDRSSARLSGPHREARPLRAIWGERILDYQPGSPERGGVVLGARQLSLAREVSLGPREVSGLLIHWAASPGSISAFPACFHHSCQFASQVSACQRVSFSACQHLPFKFQLSVFPISTFCFPL